MSVRIWSYLFFAFIQRVLPKTRLRWQERLISTFRFVQMIAVILLSTNALDLNLEMHRAFELSGILSQPVLI